MATGAILGGLAKKFVEKKISNVKKKVTGVADQMKSTIHPTNFGPIPIHPKETSIEPSEKPLTTTIPYKSNVKANL